MGTSIIGGLIFALFLTLVVVPVIYSAFESFGRWSLRTLRRS
jgi:multidrug efflux pump subunit AcrB